MTNNLDDTAKTLRAAIGMPDDRMLPIVEALVRLRITNRIKDYRIVDDPLLPDVEAMWDSVGRQIVIRRSIFDAAERGEPEARFAVAHEVGHAVLNHPTRNRKLDGRVQFGRFTEQHERDADAFASAFLAPSNLFDGTAAETPDRLAAEFGLPARTALSRFNELIHTTGLAKAVVDIPRSRVVLIDTGDYEDAFWAMSLNAEPSGRRR